MGVRLACEQRSFVLWSHRYTQEPPVPHPAVRHRNVHLRSWSRRLRRCYASQRLVGLLGNTRNKPAVYGLPNRCPMEHVPCYRASSPLLWAVLCLEPSESLEAAGEEKGDISDANAHQISSVDFSSFIASLCELDARYGDHCFVSFSCVFVRL